MKKQFGVLAAVLLGTNWAALAGGTVVVAPARYNVMQVGLDLAARNGVTLVSYQGEATTAKPLIHVWNGQEWNFVALEDFQAGKFLSEKPKQTVVVGDEQMVPQAFAPISAWAGQQQTIRAIETEALLNQLGTALKFRDADWQWYASRYNLKLQDLNAPKRKTSIYDQPFGQPFTLKHRGMTQKTSEIQPPAPPPAKTEAAEPKPAVVEAPVLETPPVEKPATK
ncbi:MAG: hypothetical protein EPN23_09355 [Verrucomicrobia bacterium]|nr:MAG: hypothetical protein EPN23_09355 [Verrucomicrobiota bacterium]